MSRIQYYGENELNVGDLVKGRHHGDVIVSYALDNNEGIIIYETELLLFLGTQEKIRFKNPSDSTLDAFSSHETFMFFLYKNKVIYTPKSFGPFYFYKVCHADGPR